MAPVGLHRGLTAWPGGGSRSRFLRRVWRCVMGSTAGRGDGSREPICTQKADGPARVYWQALLMGDQGLVAEILSDAQNNLGPDAVFDTSDLEEWKNYRFNIRRLSTRGAAGGQLNGAQSLVLPGIPVVEVASHGAVGLQSTDAWVGSPARVWGTWPFLQDLCKCLGTARVPQQANRTRAPGCAPLASPALCAGSACVQPVLGCWFSLQVALGKALSQPCIKSSRWFGLNLALGNTFDHMLLL